MLISNFSKRVIKSPFSRQLFIVPLSYSSSSLRFFSTTIVMPHQQRIIDLQSDTATEPTDEMFDIMKSASRGDDVFAEDNTVNNLEAHVARLLGKESALFCTSGTLSNQLGLRLLLTQPPHSVLCDARSHVFNYECGGIAYHSQASVSPVVPKNGHHLTVEDITSNLITDTLCSPVTKVVSLENTLNGTIMPLEEIKRIREFTKQHGLKLHLDGARLWNASQETGIPLHEYGQYFDTISVCLSKGVGAPIGSILAGSKENMTRARHLRKLMGGGWRQAGFMAAAAHHCIDHVVPTMLDTHRMAKQLAATFVNLGMTLTVPCETNMVWVDTANAGITVVDLHNALKQKNIRISSGPGTRARIVLHYQVSQYVIDTVIQVTTELVEQRKLDPTPIIADQQQSSSSIYPSSASSK